MNNLPPSLPPAGSDPLGAAFDCFWEGRDVVGISVTQQSGLLGFPAGGPFKKTNKRLQHKFPLGRYLSEWAVSFHV